MNADIIQLLPDAVASQIAAGEVIQRPASALKELMENAVDAGARRIQVILKDAGKALIQVVDDGCGMSENDARLSFERHATSKIRQATDLFSIQTMGFRGEALASVAAVARVELKTRRTGEETGVLIRIEGSEVVAQEPASCPPGTSIEVKNLFFNIPARRNFLKSNAAETRHLVDAFQRVALANPQIAFSMHHDGTELFRLAEGNLRQRIAGLFGNPYNERLVPVDEASMALKVTGYVVKPQHAKKTRGEQFFFVNGRFIKDPYLNHAVCGGMDELLPAGHFPSYFIGIHADPAHIDVNIHPSKTEVKFEDERLVYSVVKATVKRALGKFSITPSLDFEREPSFDVPLHKLGDTPRPPEIRVNQSYNPFSEGGRVPTAARKPVAGWESLYQSLTGPGDGKATVLPSKLNFETSPAEQIGELPDACFGMLGPRYLVVQHAGELLIADRRRISERIYYEELMSRSADRQVSQQHLFPQAIEFSASDFLMVREILDDVHALGFDLREFGKNTFVVHGIPFGTENLPAKRLLEEVLEDFKHHTTAFRHNKRESIARAMARSRSGGGKELLAPREVRTLLTRLFECEQPNYALDGSPAFIRITAADLDRQFSAQKQGE